MELISEEIAGSLGRLWASGARGRVGWQSATSSEWIRFSESVARWQATWYLIDFEVAKRSTLFSIDAGSVEIGRRPLFQTPSLHIGPRDRIRLAGPNGAGKTTLIDRFWKGSRVPTDRILRLPREIDSAQGRALLAEARSLDSHVRGNLMNIVAALGVDPEALLASEDLSPGEARKLALATDLARRVWGLILDEPTNHLDLPSIVDETLSELSDDARSKLRSSRSAAISRPRSRRCLRRRRGSQAPRQASHGPGPSTRRRSASWRRASRPSLRFGRQHSVE